MIGRFLRSKVMVGQAVVTTMVAVMCGFLVGYNTGAADTLAKVCHEDELVLRDGRCWPIDDSEYVGGHGWVSHDQWLWVVDTEGDR